MPKKQSNRIIVLAALVVLVVAQLFMFAAVSPDTNRVPVTIRVKKGMGVWNIADRLRIDGIIGSSCLFVLSSLAYRGKLMAGEYDLNKGMSVIDIVKKMGRGERNIYTLRILEGHNIYNIAETIEKARIMDRSEFLGLAKDLSFLTRLGIRGDSLEGYLAPDTYHYSREIEVDAFIEGIVKKTFKNFAKEDIKKRMSELNMDTHMVLTLASIIEREAKAKEEKPIIAAVFHNRLKMGMRLEADPTVIYGTRAFNEPITKSDLTTYTPYNTYSFAGLPKGPICNPDINSIRAALYPVSADYLFFVSKNDGTHVFSKSMAEHNRFVAMYQRARNAKKQ